MKKNEEKKVKKEAERGVVQTYLNEINRIPLLSKDEEKEIAKSAMEGNETARKRLINSNLRFVVMIAKKYQGKGLPMEDLISEGNIGILNALKNYNTGKDIRFISYAVWWIRQAIIKAIHEKSRMIRLPSNKSKALSRAEKQREILQNMKNNNYSLNRDELADILNMPQEKAVILQMLGQQLVSLDDPLSHDMEYLALIDCIEDNNQITPEEQALNSILGEDLERALEYLEKRDADIIRYRYGLGNRKLMTLQEIGDHYNITRERIRQIENRALNQLRSSTGVRKLESYFA